MCVIEIHKIKKNVYSALLPWEEWQHLMPHKQIQKHYEENNLSFFLLAALTNEFRVSC
jgi:hypothetical protein